MKVWNADGEAGENENANAAVTATAVTATGGEGAIGSGAQVVSQPGGIKRGRTTRSTSVNRLLAFESPAQKPRETARTGISTLDQRACKIKKWTKKKRARNEVVARRVRKKRKRQVKGTELRGS